MTSETWGIRAVTVFPSGTFPQVPIDDRLMYPIYAKCVELGIPVFCCAGVPGPRLLGPIRSGSSASTRSCSTSPISSS